MDIPKRDIEALCQEKYGGDKGANMHNDIARLAKGEPLAYVIGTQPFLGLTIHLDSHPLIPRPETEWWTEQLVAHIGTRALSVLDLCSGSGAIGLAVLKHCPHTHVTFSDIEEAHQTLTQKNIMENALDARRTHCVNGDLFQSLGDSRFDIIVCNPPYVPTTRTLEVGVTAFEPHNALFAGEDGLDIIRIVAREARSHLNTPGELWLECDIGNITEAETLLQDRGATHTETRLDQYGRPRLVLAYYS